jgi:membrane protein
MSSILPDQTEELSSSTEQGLPPKPIEDVRPVIQGEGLWAEIVALVRYMTRTEVHTYAFSVAANTILSLFPFIVLLLTVSRNVFHSRSMEAIVGDMMKNLLPVGQDFVMRNMQLLTHPHKGTQLFSVIMLLITSTGVFLPLEVALNGVWGVRQNRSYLHNQAVSLGLAFAVGVLAMASVASTASQQTILSWIFIGHTDNIVFRFISYGFLRLCAGLASILLFFLIYWVLPYRKVPAMAVLPTAIVIGLLWQFAKVLYIRALPWLDFQSVYGPFYISVGLMMWAFLSGLLLLAGAHFSATRHALRLARQAKKKQQQEEAANDAKSE